MQLSFLNSPVSSRLGDLKRQRGEAGNAQVAWRRSLAHVLRGVRGVD